MSFKMFQTLFQNIHMYVEQDVSSMRKVTYTLMRHVNTSNLCTVNQSLTEQVCVTSHTQHLPLK